MPGLSKGLQKPATGLLLVLAIMLVLLVPAGRSAAQDPIESLTANPLKPPNTASPRDTLRSFLTYVEVLGTEVRAEGRNREDFLILRNAVETMDFSTVTQSDSWTELARHTFLLKEVLDRLDLPPLDAIPGADEVADGSIARWTIPGTRISITRIESGPRAGEFVFSASTVERLGSLYRQVQHLPYKRGNTQGIYQEFLASDRTLRARLSEVRNRLKGLDTSSPRDTLEGFLDAMNQVYVMVIQADAAMRTEPPSITHEQAEGIERRAENLMLRAIGALDLSQVPRAQRQEFSVEASLQLKEVLDRLIMPPIQAVPNTSMVRAGIGSVAPPDQPFRWEVPNSQIEIVEVTEGPRAGQFLFSTRTVANIADYYEQLQDLPYRADDLLESAAIEYRSPETSRGFYEFYISTPGDLLPLVSVIGRFVDGLPPWFKEVRGGQTNWQWIGLGLSALITLIAAYAIFHIAGVLTRSMPSPWRYWARILAPILVILLVRFATDFVSNSLNITSNVLVTMIVLSEVVVLLMAAWAIVYLWAALSETIIASPRISEGGIDASLIRIISGLFSIITAIAVIVWGLRDLGVDAVPLVAGLGVGGLAVALAIRPTLENLIGGMILFIDKPVRVGDYCKFGSMSGVVENIGVRSTQIRGLDRTLISVPNAKFADLELTNYARCDSMLIDTTIGLRYETDPDQLRHVMVKIREMLHGHPKIDRTTVRVRFVDYGNSSLNVRIRIYAQTRDWNEYFAIREDVLLRVNDIVKQSGTGFAFPSQTLYMGRDDGLDKELGDAAIEEVQAWRRSGRLPFPRLADDEMDKLEGTLDYPPRGSVNVAWHDVNKDQTPEPLSTEPLSTKPLSTEPQEAERKEEESKRKRTKKQLEPERQD